MTESAEAESDLVNRVALAIAEALGEGAFYRAPGFQDAARAAIKVVQGPILPVPGLSTEPIGLNWTLGEETHRYLEELAQQQRQAAVQIGDPRLNTLIVGRKND